MTSEEYFLNVLTPNRDAFNAERSSFAAAFNLASALYHFHERLHSEHRLDLEQALNATLRNPYHLWKHIEGQGSGFGYIHDVANASQHRILDPERKHSTELRHINAVRLGWTAFGAGAYGIGPFGGSRIIVVEVGDETVDFGEIADSLFEVWRDLLQRTLGRALA